MDPSHTFTAWPGWAGAASRPPILAAVLAPVLARIAGRLRGGGMAARLPAPLALVQSIALDPRRRVSLLRCGDRHVVVLTGGGSDVVVGWLDDPPAGGGSAR
jgi:hypothetical protein